MTKDDQARPSAANEVSVGIASDGTAQRPTLAQRVVRAAESALSDRRFVSAIDVLVGIGWLAPPRLDEWRQGRVDYLEHVTQTNLPSCPPPWRSSAGGRHAVD